ncbi:hypothetical protein [Candidatus Sarmatiella mevalonica]|uniref:hypothetical protein n=1 Tax=Candidatus Sarmatiella mevalonica TaxID=2770581 RepID=UPI0019207342|nr:hypothetical protein [Candidatus Sarmatiella mevalonica]
MKLRKDSHIGAMKQLLSGVEFRKRSIDNETIHICLTHSKDIRHGASNFHLSISLTA